MVHNTNMLINNNIRITLRKSVKLDNSGNDFNYI